MEAMAALPGRGHSQVRKPEVGRSAILSAGACPTLFSFMVRGLIRGALWKGGLLSGQPPAPLCLPCAQAAWEESHLQVCWSPVPCAWFKGIGLDSELIRGTMWERGCLLHTLLFLLRAP